MQNTNLWVREHRKNKMETGKKQEKQVARIVV